MSAKRTTILLAELRESARSALGAVAAHKLRSALTLLGVLVGVFSIIVVMTTMRVMQGSVEEELSSLGSHTFLLRKYPITLFHRPQGMEKILRRKNITYQDGVRFQERMTLARGIGLLTVFWGGQVETRYKRSAPDVRLFGATPGTFPAKNWTVEDGRALEEAEVDGARDVCVLGHSLAKLLFPLGSPVGERLKIDGINYSVVGVLEPKGTALGGDEDNFAIIPITTGLNRFGGGFWRSLNILVQARDAATLQACIDEARAVFRALRKVPPGEEDSFEISTNDSLIAQFNSFTFAVRIGVAVISSIALLAAGIGIMNIMLVSVTERTREIGIRRAVGAKKRNIMTQFIMEAIVLCEVGGVLGVALGILGGTVAAIFLKVPLVVPVDWIVFG